MKKILSLILLATLFVGCSSDDDDNYSNSDIVGTWTLESKVAIEVKTNNEKATQAITKDLETIEGDEETYTFTDEGKVITSLGDKGTYKLKGNKLTMTLDGITATIEISLQPNTFSIKVDETEFYQDEVELLIPNAEDVVVSKVTVSYAYTRQ